MSNMFEQNDRQKFIYSWNSILDKCTFNLRFILRSVNEYCECETHYESENVLKSETERKLGKHGNFLFPKPQSSFSTLPSAASTPSLNIHIPLFLHYANHWHIPSSKRFLFFHTLKQLLQQTHTCVGRYRFMKINQTHLKSSWNGGKRHCLTISQYWFLFLWRPWSRTCLVIGRNQCLDVIPSSNIWSTRSFEDTTCD